VDLIDEFVARYTKEYDFYNQAGRLAAQELEATLQAAGIRSIVTYRAKSITRLQEKCRQRQKSRDTYASVSDIFDDIVDLVGVRVALYFPAEQKQVDGIIGRLFHVHNKKEFPELGKGRAGRRFTGYSAVHYRVQLKEQDLSDLDKRYAIAGIEIQVASVLMHAWSEVEHDLVYKPLAGLLSEDEYAILDQLNGLVIAGEIALERLQKAGEVRVTSSGRKFANHYDLAVHLLSHAATGAEQPVNDAELGRVDLLFDLITRLQVDTPERLFQYLEALHGDLERRPLAEQIIDALLTEDPTRYEVYQAIRADRRSAAFGSHPEDGDAYVQVGMFVSHWIELERLTRELRERFFKERNILVGRLPFIPSGRELREMELLPPGMVVEYDQLRTLRNRLVHGAEPANSAELADATQRLQAITSEIWRRTAQSGEEPFDEGDDMPH
jgi:ppGpp synthetase/RelA/SpoT-type nucleotidyltranferase